MAILLLTVGLSLIAVLQAQDPPASQEDPVDVRLEWGRECSRGLRERGDVVGSGTNLCP